MPDQIRRIENNLNETNRLEASGPYDAEAFNNLGASVFKAEEARQKAVQRWLKVRDEHQKGYRATFDDDGNEISRDVVPPLLDGEGNQVIPTFSHMVGSAVQRFTAQGDTAAAEYWRQIGLAHERMQGATDEAALQQEYDEGNLISKANDLLATGGFDFLDSASVGTLGFATRAAADVLDKLGADFEGFEGAEGFERARANMRENLHRAGTISPAGVDIHAAAATADLANLMGFIKGAGALQQGATTRLAAHAARAGELSGVGKAGLAFLSGMTPKTALATMTKAAKPGILKQAVQGAANFGAYEGLRTLVDSADAARLVLDQTGDYGKAAEAFGESVKAVPGHYLGGALSGALFPVAKKVGEAVEGSFRGVLGTMNLNSKRTLGQNLKLLWGKGPSQGAGTDLLVRGPLDAASRGIGGAFEFITFGGMPHLASDADGNFEPLGLDTVAALIGDDEVAKREALTGLLIQASHGMFIKTFRRDPNNPGRQQKSPLDWIEWAKGDKVGFPQPALPAPTKESIDAWNAAKFEKAVREGRLEDLPGTTDEAFIEVARIMAEVYERMPADQMELIVHDVLRAMEAEGVVMEKLNLGASIVAEARRRAIETLDRETLKDDVDTNLDKATDALATASAKKGLLPGLEKTDPEVVELEATIKRLTRLSESLDLDPADQSKVAEELGQLRRRLSERQTELFETGEGDAQHKAATAKFAEAVMEKAKAEIAERKKAAADDAKRIKQTQKKRAEAEKGSKKAEKEADDIFGEVSRDIDKAQKKASAPENDKQKAKREANERRAAAASNAKKEEARLKTKREDGLIGPKDLVGFMEAKQAEFQGNPAAEQSYLRAAEYLRETPHAEVVADLARGKAGLRDKGVTGKAAEFIVAQMQVPKAKPVPPGRKPKTTTTKATPGKKPAPPATAVQKLADHFNQIPGFKLEGDKAARFFRSFEGMDEAAVRDRLNKSIIPDKDFEGAVQAVLDAHKPAPAPKKPVAERAAEVFVDKPKTVERPDPLPGKPRHSKRLEETIKNLDPDAPKEVFVAPADAPKAEAPKKAVPAEKARKIHDTLRVVQSRTPDAKDVKDPVSMAKVAAQSRAALISAAQNAQGAERAELDRLAQDAHRIQRWYEKEVSDREARVEIDAEQANPRFDEKGKRIEGKEAQERAEFWTGLDREEQIRRLEEIAETGEVPGLRENLELVMAGVDRAQATDVTLGIEGRLPYTANLGDRIVTTVDGKTVDGVVLTPPKRDASGLLVPGRRVTLFDGTKNHRVRLRDIDQWSPASIQDLDTSVGRAADGTVRDGAEVTAEQFANLTTPKAQPAPKEATLSDPSLDTKTAARVRKALLAGETEGFKDKNGKAMSAKKAMAVSARARAKRMAAMRGIEHVHPEDWRLAQQVVLVPAEHRTRIFAPEPGAEGKSQKVVARLLNKRERGGRLTPAEVRRLPAAGSPEMLALEFFAQDYYDPAKAKPRTIEQLREQAKTDPQAKKDLDRWSYLQMQADSAEAYRLANHMTEIDRKNADHHLRSLAQIEGAAGPEAIIVRSKLRSDGAEANIGGQQKYIHAVYQADTNTWKLRDFAPGEAIKWVRENVDGEADVADMQKFERSRRKVQRNLNKNLVTDRAIVDAAAEGRLQEALDQARRWGRGDLTETNEIDGFRDEFQQIVRMTESTPVDRSAELRHHFGGEAMKRLDDFIKQNPRPTDSPKREAEWDRDFEALLTQGRGSLLDIGRRRIIEGLDPLTGEALVRDPNTGAWAVEKPKGRPIPPVGMVLGGFDWSNVLNPGDWRRDIVGASRSAYNAAKKFLDAAHRGVLGPAYGLLRGTTSDIATDVFRTFITGPAQRLSHAMYAIATKGGHRDAIDVAIGHSDRAEHTQTRHNRHLAQVDLFKSEHNKFVAELLSKHSRDELLDAVRAEHEGGRPALLDPYRRQMRKLAKMAKKLGLSGDEFDKRFDGRYVRFGRWRLPKKQFVEQAQTQAQAEADRITNEIAAIQAAQAGSGQRVSNAVSDKLNRLTRELQHTEQRVKTYESLLRRLNSLWPGRSGVSEIRNVPLTIIDAKGIKDFESSGKRFVNDWDKAVELGLDVSRPELLLLDSMNHAAQAIVDAMWFREIAADPQLSRPVKDAPKGWVVLGREELGSNFAMKTLAGRAVSPWLHHYISIGNGANGLAERAWNYMHSVKKMGLTVAAPSVWVLQVAANPLTVGAAAGTSVLRSTKRYIESLAKMIASKKYREKYRPFRWVDTATDFDREIAEELSRRTTTDSDSVVRHFLDMMGKAGAGDTFGAAMEGAKGAGTAGLKGLSKMLSFFRLFDAAGRAATYELLVEGGMSPKAAENKVNGHWDILHLNKAGDFIRRGVLRTKSGKGIPIGAGVSSFASVPLTFGRKLSKIGGAAPLQLAEIAFMTMLWNSVIQQSTGQTDDEVDRITSDMHGDSNALINWIRRKTTPLSMSGQQGVDLWNYHPVNAALEAVPGMKSATWGAADYISSGGERGGLFEGTDAYGNTMSQSIVHQILGGKNVLVSPWAEYELDRDAQGNKVRYRYEAPGLFGATGRKRLFIESGQATLLGVSGLASAMRLPIAAGAEMAAVATAMTRTLAEIDKTGMGNHPSFELIAHGEDIFDVRPKSELDVAMRRLGIKVRNPDAFRRFFERVARTKGIEEDRGAFRVEGEIPQGNLRAQLTRLAREGNKLKKARSGAFLWGMARFAHRHRGSEASKNVIAEIKRRWPTDKSRRDATRALVTLDMSKEMGETRRLLAELGMPIVDPDTVPAPPSSPEDVRKRIGR